MENQDDKKFIGIADNNQEVEVIKAQSNRVVGVPFEKGNVANPRGRPKKTDRLADEIERLGMQPVNLNGELSTRYNHLGKIIWRNALKSKPFFIKTLMEIQAGQMKRLEISTNAEGEVIIGWRSRGKDDEKGPL